MKLNWIDYITEIRNARIPIQWAMWYQNGLTTVWLSAQQVHFSGQIIHITQFNWPYRKGWEPKKRWSSQMITPNEKKRCCTTKQSHREEEEEEKIHKTKQNMGMRKSEMIRNMKYIRIYTRKQTKRSKYTKCIWIHTKMTSLLKITILIMFASIGKVNRL